MSTWTLRLVFPQSLRRTVEAYQTVACEELESRLQADTIRELQHYFFHRRRGTDLTAIPETLRAIPHPILGDLRRAAIHPPLQAMADRRKRGADADLTGDSRGSRVASCADRMRGPPSHVRPSLSPGKPSAGAASRTSAGGREGGRDSAQHQPVPQPRSLTRSHLHDGRVVAAILRRRPPR